MSCQNVKKIVITGGPGAGKTTALDMFKRELNSQISIVPEAATMLFNAGVKKETDPNRIKLLQKAIYQTQTNIEGVYRCLYPETLLICDRGTLDGLAYWPNTQEDFFKQINSSYEIELARYDAVIFFQSGAADAHDMKSNNPFRSETTHEAMTLDEKLQEVWRKHPSFHFVPTSRSFIEKINKGIDTIRHVLAEIENS